MEGAITSDSDGGAYVSEVGDSIVARVSATLRPHAMHGAFRLELSPSLSLSLPLFPPLSLSLPLSLRMAPLLLAYPPPLAHPEYSPLLARPASPLAALPCSLQVNRSGGIAWALTPLHPSGWRGCNSRITSPQTALAPADGGGVLVAGNFEWPSNGMPIVAMKVSQHGHVLWFVSLEEVKSLIPHLIVHAPGQFSGNLYPLASNRAYGIVADGSGGAFVTWSMEADRHTASFGGAVSYGVCLHVGSEGEIIWVAEPESMQEPCPDGGDLETCHTRGWKVPRAACKRCFNSEFYGVVTDGRGGALISGTTHASHTPPSTRSCPAALRCRPHLTPTLSYPSLVPLSTLTYAFFSPDGRLLA